MRFPKSQILQALMLITLSIHMAACTKYAPVPLPAMQVNPNPTERYQITIRIDDEALSPERVVGKSTYAVDNPEQCLPVDYTRALGGVRPELYREQPQAYEKIDTHVFRTYVYEDAFLNEDYYGMGVCDWGVQVVTAEIMTGRLGQEAGVTRQNIISEKPLVLYCSDNGDPKLGCNSTERFDQLDPEVKARLHKVEIQSRKVTR